MRYGIRWEKKDENMISECGRFKILARVNEETHEPFGWRLLVDRKTNEYMTASSLGAAKKLAEQIIVSEFPTRKLMIG